MKTLVMPNDLANINVFDKSDGFIVGIKHFSWFVPYMVTIDELKEIVFKIKQNKQSIFVSLNKLMYNKDIPLLKEYLLVIEGLGVDGILYDDIAVLNLSMSLNMATPLVWFGIHSFTNHYASNYWHSKGVKYGILSTEITLDHIKEISRESKLSTMIYGYGYLPMFVSSRPLLSSYFEYIGSDKKDITYHMYEETRKTTYPTYENETGTIILSSDIINTIDELPSINETIDYLILSSLNIQNDNFEGVYSCYMEALSHLEENDILKNLSLKVADISDSMTDKGFLYKETVYRVKNDG